MRHAKKVRIRSCVTKITGSLAMREPMAAMSARVMMFGVRTLPQENSVRWVHEQIRLSPSMVVLQPSVDHEPRSGSKGSHAHHIHTSCWSVELLTDRFTFCFAPENSICSGSARPCTVVPRDIERACPNIVRFEAFRGKASLVKVAMATVAIDCPLPSNKFITPGPSRRLPILRGMLSAADAVEMGLQCSPKPGVVKFCSLPGSGSRSMTAQMSSNLSTKSLTMFSLVTFKSELLGVTSELPNAATIGPITPPDSVTSVVFSSWIVSDLATDSAVDTTVPELESVSVVSSWMSWEQANKLPLSSAPPAHMRSTTGQTLVFSAFRSFPA
mmetsp:Transcript_142422/g.248416  ORF Transcript_142422/g.248416 Transcript_142422/m.248416 type:complete len:328 (-) Transcript_142422:275-1258(-)